MTDDLTEDNKSLEEQTNEVVDTQPQFVVKTFEEQPEATNDIIDNNDDDDTDEDQDEQEEIVDIETLINDPDYEEAEIEEEEEEEEEQQSTELDEVTAFNFIKKSRGIEAETIDEFIERTKKTSTSEELPEEVQKFIAFKKETGNSSYEDFLATQKDWTKEDSAVVLKNFLKSQNEGLSEKEINHLFKKNYDYDEDFDDEDVVMDKEINKKRDLQKAYQHLEEQKEKYKVNRGSADNVPEEFKQAANTLKEIENQNRLQQDFANQVRQEFLTKTEQVFSNNFEGFKVTVDGKEHVVKPQNVNETKMLQSDLVNFEKKFFDDKHNLIDPQGYHKALHFAYNPDAIAEHFINIGKALQAEQDERESKNIRMDNVQKVPSENPMKLTVKAVKG